MRVSDSFLDRLDSWSEEPIVTFQLEIALRDSKGMIHYQDYETFTMTFALNEDEAILIFEEFLEIAHSNGAFLNFETIENTVVTVPLDKDDIVLTDEQLIEIYE
jgi:hypothetical protein